MAGPVATFRAGKSGRIICGPASAILFANEWAVQDEADKLDTTSFETNGQEQLLTGIEGLGIDIKSDWNAGTNQSVSPPGIYPQDLFPNTALYENIADATFWNVPYMCILSAQNSANVRQKVIYNFAGRAQPGWARPA